jgi:hypothetical protein
MYTDVIVADRIAEERRKDLLREADQARLIHQASTPIRFIGRTSPVVLVLVERLFARLASL